MPFTGDILLYGGGQGYKQQLKFYDNGLMRLLWPILGLYEQVDESFFTIGPEALNKYKLSMMTLQMDGY